MGVTAPLVVLEALEKSYGEHHAVRSIDLEIRTGEFIAIMGPSGCGKSTTLRLIAGLEGPDRRPHPHRRCEPTRHSRT